jgi:radical SAM protein (TIGR01212 family)
MTNVRRYHTLASHLRGRFGTAVRSVSVDAGFTCPNVDGTVTTGGCVYCDNRSFSPTRRLPRTTIRAQLDRGIGILTRRFGAEKFLAYFQAGTNTHGPLDKLRRVYAEALDHPQVIGLAIGTRPDSVPEPVLDLLDEFRRRVPMFLELGLQTIHDRSLDWMNRGHRFDAFLDAVDRCSRRDLELCAHVILGLPGESREDMLDTARVLARLPVHGVKIHNLYVVRDTPMAGMYERGEVRMMERDEYVGVVCDFLEILPPEMVIYRVSGESPPEYFIAPQWALDKPALLRAIDTEFERRDSRQGARYVLQPSLLVEQPTRRVALPLA